MCFLIVLRQTVSKDIDMKTIKIVQLEEIIFNLSDSNNDDGRNLRGVSTPTHSPKDPIFCNLF